MPQMAEAVPPSEMQNQARFNINTRSQYTDSKTLQLILKKPMWLTLGWLKTTKSLNMGKELGISSIRDRISSMIDIKPIRLPHACISNAM